MRFMTMRQIDSTAQSIDALIQIGALDAARDLLRAELGPLSTHVGTSRVEAWCAALGLTQLLDLPRALAAANDLRERRGSAAIAAFAAIAQTAQACGDKVSEFRALSGIYCTGTLLWTGFGDMQRSFARINALFEATQSRLSKDEAIECLPGLLAARMLFGQQTSDASSIGEAVVLLVFDARLNSRTRLRAATLLAPWFEHARDADRLRRTTESLAPLVQDETIDAATRLIFRSATALAGVYFESLTEGGAGLTFSSDELIADADALGMQWLRFFTHRVAFEQTTRAGDSAQANARLDQLEALVDPADASQVLALHYRRANRALRANEYAAALAHSQRCMELARALEMPQPIALLYENSAAASLVGLHRLAEAKAIYLSMIAKSMPGHRLGYERLCALIDVAAVLDDAASPDKIEHDALRTALEKYVEVCAGRLPPMHTQIFPSLAQRVVASLYAFGFGNDTLIADVRALSVSPPPARPVTWPWVLRVRLFDGYICDGLAATAQENSKKADSKTTQILQYLAAHAPAAVSAQRLADALWPEAEGDKAMRSLDVALTRLRQSLPDASLLTRHDGKIGFDLDRVWCDTHAVLAQVEQLRDFANVVGTSSPQNGVAAVSAVTADTLARDTAQAHTALALLTHYRGPLLPDSREAFARDRAAFFRSQVAGAVQIGLRAAIRLAEPILAEEIVRKSVSHGLPADVVRSVIVDMQARGEDTSRRAAQLSNVFELARA